MDKISKELEIRKKPNSYYVEYTYYHSIEEVWELLRDLPKWMSIQNYFTNVEIIKGKNTHDIGSQYKLIYKDIIPLVYETKKFYEDEFTKQISFECIENKVNDIRYYGEYNLYKNTFQNTTLLTCELEYFKEIGCSLIEVAKFDKIQLLKLNDKYITKTKKYESDHIETCILKRSKSYIWDLMIDFKKFTKLIPNIADEVRIKDDKLVLNSELILKYNKQNLEIPLIVNILKNDENLKTWTIGFKVVNKKEKKSKKLLYTPFQEISFELLEIDTSIGSKTLFIFKHTLKENEVTINDLKDLEINKLLIIKKIKKCFSKK